MKLEEDQFVVKPEYLYHPELAIEYYVFLCRSQQTLVNYIMEATAKAERLTDLNECFGRIDHINHLASELRPRVLGMLYECIDAMKPSVKENYWGLPVEYQAQHLPVVHEKLVDLVAGPNGLDDEVSKPPLGLMPQRIYMFGNTSSVGVAGDRDEELSWLSEAGTPIMLGDVTESSLLFRAKALFDAYLRYTTRGYNLPCHDATEHCSEIWLDELVEINLEMSQRRAATHEKSVNQILNIHALFPEMFSEQDMEKLNRVGLLNG